MERQINPEYVRVLGRRPVRPGDITYRTTDPIPDGDTQPQPGYGYPIRDAVDTGRLVPGPIDPPRRRLRDHGLAVIAAAVILIAVVVVLDLAGW